MIVEERIVRIVDNHIAEYYPQRKLIRCKDCRFYKKETLHCDMNAGKWFVADYCSYAERKEE